MSTRRKRPPWPLRSGLLILLGVVLSACPAPNTSRPPPCECPHLEDAVDSVDWAPGLTLDSAESGGDGPHEVVRIWRDAEDLAAARLSVDRVREALAASGFDVGAIEPDASTRHIEASTDQLLIVVMTSIATESRTAGIRVAVRYEGEDGSEVDGLFEDLRAELGSAEPRTPRLGTQP